MFSLAPVIPVAAEFFGSFFFLSVILKTGQSIPIGLALSSAIYAFGPLSGGHFNPAVSTVMLTKGDISLPKYFAYMGSQAAGAMSAFLWWKLTHEDPVQASSTIDLSSADFVGSVGSA